MTSASTTRADTFEWLAIRLDQWGAWRRSGVSIGLGYGSLLGRYTKHDTPRTTSVEHDNPAFDRMMMDLDTAIRALPADFQQIIRLHHDHNDIDDALPASEAAHQLGCSVSTYYRRLRAAYVLLAGWVKP